MAPRSKIIAAWQIDNGYNQTGFIKWLKDQTDFKTIRGDFHNGWIIEFTDEKKYMWFLLKWS